MIILLNMSDLAEERGIKTDAKKMEQQLGVPVLPIVAKHKNDIEKVRRAIAQHDLKPTKPLSWQPKEPLHEAIDIITDGWLKPHTDLPHRSYPIEALRLISDNQVPDDFNLHAQKDVAREVIAKAQSRIERSGHNPAAAEVMARYDFIEGCTKNGTNEQEQSETLSDKIDTVVTHKVFGPIIFVAILLLMFQSIFSWAEPFMDLIDLLFIYTGNYVAQLLPAGILNDCLLYTSPSPRDGLLSRMPSSA